MITNRIKFEDQEDLICLDCGEKFTFSGGEARFYASKGLTIPPKRCQACRIRRKLLIVPDPSKITIDPGADKGAPQ